MEKHNKNNALDDDIIEMLAEAHEPVEIDEGIVLRLRSKLMKKISQEKMNSSLGFSTMREADNEGWIDAFPGGSFKVLHGDASIPNSILSYLVKLEPGFKMEGHDHPFDEETLMIEGDLTLGDLTFHAGDFHFAPAGSSHGKVSTKNGCVAYMRGALPI
jgi:hypothetical protein